MYNLEKRKKIVHIFISSLFAHITRVSQREVFSTQILKFLLCYFERQTILNDTEKTISLQISLLQVVQNVIGRSLKKFKIL